MASSEEILAVVDAPGGDSRLRCLALLHGAAVVGRFDPFALLVRAAVSRGETWLRLEEAALQVVAYGGFPRALEALALVAAARGGPAAADATEGRDRAALASEGLQTFRQVYGRGAATVRQQLESLVPGFSGWVLEDAYGRILSRPGLSLGEREILAVAALALAALPTPLGGHVRGALRNGFPPTAVEDILHACSVLADPEAEAVIQQARLRLSCKVDHE